MGWLVFLHIMLWAFLLLIVFICAKEDGGFWEWTSFIAGMAYFLSFLLFSPHPLEEPVVVGWWMSPTIIVVITGVAMACLLRREFLAEENEKEILIKEIAFWTGSGYDEAGGLKDKTLSGLQHHLNEIRKSVQ